MKKILLTTAAAVILSTSSVYSAEDMFYVKANVGWSKLDSNSWEHFVDQDSNHNH